MIPLCVRSAPCSTRTTLAFSCVYYISFPTSASAVSPTRPRRLATSYAATAAAPALAAAALGLAKLPRGILVGAPGGVVHDARIGWSGVVHRVASGVANSVLALGLAPDLAPRLAQDTACGRGNKLGRRSLDGRCLIATHGLARTALVVSSARRSSFAMRSKGRHDSSEIARGFAAQMLATGLLSVGRRTAKGLAEGGGRLRIAFGL